MEDITRPTVMEVDLNAFIIITSANEIVGEGYKSPLEDRM